MFRPNAEKQVKLRFALEKIAELENVIVEESDIDEQYKKLAEAYKIEDVEKVKNAETTEYITKDLSLQKAYEFVKANAVLTEEKKKAPAKKPAAKADDSTEKKSAAKKTAAKKTTCLLYTSYQGCCR